MSRSATTCEMLKPQGMQRWWLTLWDAPDDYLQLTDKVTSLTKEAPPILCKEWQNSIDPSPNYFCSDSANQISLVWGRGISAGPHSQRGFKFGPQLPCHLEYKARFFKRVAQKSMGRLVIGTLRWMITSNKDATCKVKFLSYASFWVIPRRL
jgi:hypothetical protein